MVDPIARSLSESVGGLKSMAGVAEKLNKIMIEKRIDLTIHNQYQIITIMHNQCTYSCHFERIEAESRNPDSV
jgi:hypothetical protein